MVAELMSIHNQYQQLLNPEERSADDDMFDEEDWSIRNFKTEAIKYLQMKVGPLEHRKSSSRTSVHSKKSLSWC